jgi:hypothetical protein
MSLIMHDPQASYRHSLRTVFGDNTQRAIAIKQELLSLKPINQFNTRKWQQNQGASMAMAESLNWKFSGIQKSLSILDKPKM